MMVSIGNLWFYLLVWEAPDTVESLYTSQNSDSAQNIVNIKFMVWNDYSTITFEREWKKEKVCQKRCVLWKKQIS